MTNNLFIGGFPYETTPEQLAELFKTCGGVLGVKILRDRETGRSRGLAFVEMADEAAAAAAIAKLDGTSVGGRKMFVGEARPQEKKPGAFGARPAFAPRPASVPPPGFVERRSGKDRRQGWGPVGGERRAERPAAPQGRGERPFDRAKKPWGSKPGFGGKKPWEKRPAFGGAGEGERKPFGEKKPWSPGGPKKWTPGGPKSFAPGGPKKWSADAPKKSWTPGGPKKSWAPGGPKKKWTPGGPKKWAGKPRKSGGFGGPPPAA